jgi:internalin A
LPEAVGQQTPTTNYKTFTDWCANKAKLNPEARHTVDVLLEQVGTNECEPANQKLSSLGELILSNNKISDITPLKSLTNLTSLDLSVNKISDITPLKSLTNLSELYLWGNPIANKTCPLKPQSICEFDHRAFSLMMMIDIPGEASLY